MEQQLKSSWQHMLERLGEWLDTAITNLPNMILAIVVFTIAYWLSQNVRHWVERPMRRFVKQTSIRTLVANIASILVVAFGLFLALGILNLDTVLKSLLAGAGVAGLAVGLALQGTISNTFSGVFLAVKDIINVGDFVETNGYSGKVEEITLRNTKVREADNNIVIIPNKMVLDNPFKNYGLTRKIRASVECGVSYDADLNYVQQLTKDTIKDVFPQEIGDKVEFHYLSFGDSAINFQVRFWLPAKSKLTMLEARSKAMIVLKRTFERHNIEIPFPMRTLHIQSEGESLRERLYPAMMS